MFILFSPFLFNFYIAYATFELPIITKGDIELLSFLPLPATCWDYRYVLPHAVYVLSETELKLHVWAKQVLYQLNYSPNPEIPSSDEFLCSMSSETQPWSLVFSSSYRDRNMKRDAAGGNEMFTVPTMVYKAEVECTGQVPWCTAQL